MSSETAQSTSASGGAQAAPSFSALHALAALATHLGLETSVEQLRRQFALEESVLGPKAIVAMAREIGLDARTLHVRFAELPRLANALPAMLCATNGGALILEDARSDPMKGTVVIVRDPAAPPEQQFEIEEVRLASVWEGEVILVKRAHNAHDETRPFGMAWLFTQVLRERKLFFDIGIASLVNTVFALAPPFMMMVVVDRVLVNRSGSTLAVLFGAILLILLFETLLSFLRRHLTQVATTRIDGRLNLFVLDRLLKLPMEYFERTPTGQTLGKLGQIGSIRNFLTGQLFGSLLDAVPLLGLVPAMLILNWRLSLFAFALTAIIFVIVWVFVPPVGRAYAAVVAAENARMTHLVETMHGIKTVKSLVLEGRRRKEWDRLVATSLDAQHHMGIVANYPQTFILPFERLIYSGSMMLGAYLVLSSPEFNAAAAAAGGAAASSDAGSNPGGLMAFAMLAGRLAMPLIKIATLQQDLAEARGAIGQVAGVLNQPPEQTRLDGMKQAIRGEILFKDVKFRYSNDAPFALDGVNITVPPGTMLGIMGRSGSGKTTVTRLLQRLNSSYEGMIKIDGMDLREIDLQHLRTHIGVVPQENFLFKGSIRDNIAMAKPNASFMDVVRAAQLAGAEEFIERLPRGYDTILEEGATNLSGGQRQRLAIARALLINPPVLILDEATSALDAESEAIVNANLKRMAKGRTVLSISHRLSMLVEADAILVLERGKVYDIGTHDELVQRCDIYRHMWFQQNRHLDPEANTAKRMLSHAALADAAEPGKGAAA